MIGAFFWCSRTVYYKYVRIKKKTPHLYIKLLLGVASVCIFNVLWFNNFRVCVCHLPQWESENVDTDVSCALEKQGQRFSPLLYPEGDN